MFDTIVVDPNILPVDKATRKKLGNVWFQTKCLDRRMDTYEVVNKRLTKHRWRQTDEVDRMMPAAPPFFEEPYPIYKQERLPSLDMDYYGEINFYGIVGGISSKTAKWIEFTAYFDGGKLKNIELVSYREMGR